MKINFTRDFGTITVALDEKNREQDRAKCRKLEELYTSENWYVLTELMAQAEQKYDEALMKVKPTETSARECQVYAARKNGFCEAMSLLRKTVEAYQEYRVEQKEILNQQIDEMLGGTPDEISVNE